MNTSSGVLVRSVLIAVVGVTGSTLWTVPSGAQVPDPVISPYDLRVDSYVGVGLVVNIPRVPTGISVFQLVRGGWGWFADLKHSLDSREGDQFFRDDMTLAEAQGLGHPRFADESAYTAVTVGVVRAVHAEVAVFAGAGYTSRDAFRGFRDPSGEMGDDGGHYYVRHDGDSRSGMNLTGGVLLQAGRVLFFRLGGELFPTGANVGISLALPR